MLAAVGGGRRAAFGRCYRTRAPAAGYLRSLGVLAPADLTDEVNLKAFTPIGAFEADDQQLRSWVLTTAHQRLTDDRGGRGRRPLSPRVSTVCDGAKSGNDVEEEDARRRRSTRRVRALASHPQLDRRPYDDSACRPPVSPRRRLLTSARHRPLLREAATGVLAPSTGTHPRAAAWSRR
jgi:hypothetical protein